MFKFADDVDLVSTLDNYHKIQDEMDHIASWAADNNLILNKVKTREVIFVKGRGVDDSFCHRRSRKGEQFLKN